MEKTTKLEALLSVIKDWRLTLSGLMGIALLLPIYNTAQFFTVIIGFNLLFNAFDLLGYRNVLQSETHNTQGIELPSYRIMQSLFQVTLLVLIYLLYGWKVVLCAELLHWCGFQDWLYYFIGRYKMPGVWTWLTWSPVGFFNGDVTDKELTIQILIGMMVSILIYWFF